VVDFELTGSPRIVPYIKLKKRNLWSFTSIPAANIMLNFEFKEKIEELGQ
jgi:hypothetical protein